jgi:hypothetical protein
MPFAPSLFTASSAYPTPPHPTPAPKPHQAVQRAPHADDVIVGVGAEQQHTLGVRRRALGARAVVGAGLAAGPAWRAEWGLGGPQVRRPGQDLPAATGPLAWGGAARRRPGPNARRCPGSPPPADGAARPAPPQTRDGAAEVLEHCQVKVIGRAAAGWVGVRVGRCGVHDQRARGREAERLGPQRASLDQTPHTRSLRLPRRGLPNPPAPKPSSSPLSTCPAPGLPGRAPCSPHQTGWGWGWGVRGVQRPHAEEVLQGAARLLICTDSPPTQTPAAPTLPFPPPEYGLAQVLRQPRHRLAHVAGGGGGGGGGGGA